MVLIFTKHGLNCREKRFTEMILNQDYFQQQKYLFKTSTNQNVVILTGLIPEAFSPSAKML